MGKTDGRRHLRENSGKLKPKAIARKTRSFERYKTKNAERRNGLRRRRETEENGFEPGI